RIRERDLYDGNGSVEYYLLPTQVQGDSRYCPADDYISVYYSKLTGKLKFFKFIAVEISAKTTVYDQIGTGDKRSFAAAEPDYRVGDFFRMSAPLQRSLVFHLVSQPVGNVLTIRIHKILAEPGGNITGTDSNDP